MLEGDTIEGRYTIARALGEGAMGSVYAAIGPDDSEVALKVVNEAGADELRAPQRFLREVKSLNKLDHPNIVQLLDFGRDEERGLSYMVMELVHGDDVSRLVAHGRSRLALALLVAQQAASALSLAHSQGVVHRDLKPANLMLCPDRDGLVQLKLLDFGLAMLLDAETRLTKTGTAPGTVSYMSPEQLLGDPVDHRADIYSLGVILYEMLSGHAPFAGENQTETALAVLNSTPPRLDEVVDDLPGDAADLVHSMMSRRSEDRPPDADALAELTAALVRSTGTPEFRVAHAGSSDDPRSDWRLR